MRVLIASVEVSPLAKVGGLADVAGSLPKALRALGVDARIVMPAYGMVVKGKKPLKTGIRVDVNGAWSPLMDVWEETLDGVPTYLIGHPGSFETTTKSEELYQYGRDEYLFFAAGALALCEELDWIPDVIHANDWHTGFLPVMLREKAGAKWEKSASIFTIHNLQYQGTFGKDTLEAAGLSESLFTSDKLENWGGVNFLKSACVYADRVNTVSPTYAQEITTPEYGVGQWGLMAGLAKEGRLSGIVNGIDYDHFNPAADPHIAAAYSASILDGKAECKKALQRELGLPEIADVPLFGIVSRLSDQKGFDLIFKQAIAMLVRPAQFVALGTGDPGAARELRQLEQEWPDRVRFIERYDAPLAQRIYAGSDVFLMPSRFEPCGLGQMIACRYGTLPIVRSTGGLADTIREEQNGFVFPNVSAKELYACVDRAATAFADPPRWRSLVTSAMHSDFSWNVSAGAYKSLYEEALEARCSAPERCEAHAS